MRAHNNFMGGLDVIVIGDLYQAPLVRDAWIFIFQSFCLNELAPNFWKEWAKCYELVQVMWQEDLQFIGILNQFQIATQIEHDITYINKICFRLLPTAITFLHLFYTNVKTNEHKKYVFDNSLRLCETYKFFARDIPETCPPSYKLSDKSSLIGGLHAEIFLKDLQLPLRAWCG